MIVMDDRRSLPLSNHIQVKASGEYTRRALFFLHSMAKALSAVRTPTQLKEVMPQLVTHYFGGWCIIHVPREDGGLLVTSIFHCNPDKQRQASNILSLSPECEALGSLDFSEVLETGLEKFYPQVCETELRSLRQDGDVFRLFSGLNLRAAMILPLRVGDRGLGTMTICSDLRSFEWRDLFVAREVAESFSLALDHAALLVSLEKAIDIRDELISVSSHEIRTPLTSLKLLTDLLQRTSSEPERFSDASQKVLSLLSQTGRQIDQTTALLDQLLDLSQLESRRRSLICEVVDLGDLIQEVILSLQQQSIGTSIELEILCSPHPLVTGDRLRLIQLMVNLLVNALKYGEGSTITIQVLTCPLGVRTRVIDRGRGVPPEVAEQIFERFDRGAMTLKGKGHGLGLYICRSIVSLHGGRIWLEPSRPHGATFVFDLPEGKHENGV